MIVCFCLAVAVVPCLYAQADYQNPVKKTLREGKPVVGLTMSIPSPDVAVQAASLGFDYLWIEMEHSPITLESLHDIVLATRGTSCIPFARVPVNEPGMAKRVLDSGVLGVIFPFVSTPELARQAVERIGEIAAVPGIDVVFIAPTDLSFSYGFRGKQEAPEVQAAIAKIVAAAKKRNVPVGRTLVGAEGADLIKQGFTFFQASSELSYMAAGAQAAIKGVGKTPPDLKSRPLY